MIFKVLIVDDDYINRRLLVSLVKKELYHVDIIESVDGGHALQLCQENQDIQLILLDIEMPRMDGSEFLKHYFQTNSQSKVPIIALSSTDLRVKEVLKLGAGAFILKPVTEEKLLNAIRTVQKS